MFEHVPSHALLNSVVGGVVLVISVSFSLVGLEEERWSWARDDPPLVEPQVTLATATGGVSVFLLPSSLLTYSDSATPVQYTLPAISLEHSRSIIVASAAYLRWASQATQSRARKLCCAHEDQSPETFTNSTSPYSTQSPSPRHPRYKAYKATSARIENNVATTGTAGDAPV